MTRLHLGPIPLSALQSRSREGILYAILDTCDAPQIRAKIKEHPDRSVCLYRARKDEELPSSAPFLVSVDEELQSWIVKEVWNDAWGIFVLSRSEPRLLRRHLRKFLVVKSPTGEPWYFRYYDPRVIRTFLATCSSQELDDFFGPVAAFAFVDGAGELQAAKLTD